MRGESDRECRAAGGALKKQAHKNVEREARGAHPKNTPDASISRGSGPLFRKRGGKVPPQFAEEREKEEEEGRAKGGRVRRAAGGTIAGGGKKPSMGRAARAQGGTVGSTGADLHPMTHHAPSGPKQRKQMPDSERTP